jgi:hypothetical protein
MGVKRLALLFTLAGCDKLFDLEHLGPRDGGATGTDTPPADAFVCQTPVNHDEDSDGRDDACDACPTIGPQTDADLDGDALPDPCDRDDTSTGDKILAYWTFPTSDLGGVAVTNGNYIYLDTNNGMFEFGFNTTVATKLAYPLTRVDFHVAGVMMADINSVLQLQIGGQTFCTFKGAPCSGTNAGVCQQNMGSTSTWPMPSTAARRVSLYRDQVALRCEISDDSNDNPVGVTGVTLPSGSVGFATSSTTKVTVKSVVIYGAN